MTQREEFLLLGTDERTPCNDFVVQYMRRSGGYEAVSGGGGRLLFRLIGVSSLTDGGR